MPNEIAVSASSPLTIPLIDPTDRHGTATPADPTGTSSASASSASASSASASSASASSASPSSASSASGSSGTAGAGSAKTISNSGTLFANPSFQLNADLGIVVIQFRDAQGSVTSQIPSQKQLEAYLSGSAKLPQDEGGAGPTVGDAA